jgi:hypothetical protein
MTWMIARISSFETPLFIAQRQWVPHSAIFPSVIIDMFIIERVFFFVRSHHRPIEPQHHAVIA